jgi:two-component system nitrogen regulation sensor histidine kinase GlnL
VHEVLDRLLALEARSEGWKEIDLQREYDPSIPELQLDPDRITQVFLNLVRNAVQSMDGRGRLLLRTRVETIYQLAPSSEAREPSRMVRIDIEDSGPGIPAEDLPHVFTPFFTRREKGTGLGLAIAQQWVVRHEGRIQVSAGEHGGTRARVLLPIRRCT